MARVHLVLSSMNVKVYSSLRFVGTGSRIRDRGVFVMKIINRNIEGLGYRKKRRVVKDFLRHENPNVIMFQETKMEVCEGGLLVVFGRMGIRIRLLFRLLGHCEGF